MSDRDPFRPVPGRGEMTLGCLTRPAYEKGFAKGFAEGFAEGKTWVFTRLLEEKFGALPDAVRQRILSADLASLESWFDRAIDAPDLESVFKSG